MNDRKKEIVLRKQQKDGTVLSAFFNVKSGCMTTMLMEGKVVLEMKSRILEREERSSIKTPADIDRYIRRGLEP